MEGSGSLRIITNPDPRGPKTDPASYPGHCLQYITVNMILPWISSRWFEAWRPCRTRACFLWRTAPQQREHPPPPARCVPAQMNILYRDYNSSLRVPGAVSETAIRLKWLLLVFCTIGEGQCWRLGLRRHNYEYKVPEDHKKYVVYLGWPIAPSYMSPNAGGGGGDCGVSAYEYR